MNYDDERCSIKRDYIEGVKEKFGSECLHLVTTLTQIYSNLICLINFVQNILIKVKYVKRRSRN